MSDTIVFLVPGIPAPGGSKKAFPRIGRDGRQHVAVMDTSKRVKPWRAVVVHAAELAMAGRPPLRGPLKLEITFTLPRPKGHYGTGRNAGRVKATAPRWHTTKPDALKLRRPVEDALTGVCWVDDNQIAVGSEVKVYGERAGAEVRITELVEGGGE